MFSHLDILILKWSATNKRAAKMILVTATIFKSLKYICTKSKIINPMITAGIVAIIILIKLSLFLMLNEKKFLIKEIIWCLK